LNSEEFAPENDKLNVKYESDLCQMNESDRKEITKILSQLEQSNEKSHNVSPSQMFLNSHILASLSTK
jgi:hypothetical protein